jgi:hypothetical protein
MRHKECDPVVSLIYMMFKLFWWALLAELWLCWALVALTVALIASLTGHDRAARQWTRSMNWRRVF